MDSEELKKVLDVIEGSLDSVCSKIGIESKKMIHYGIKQGWATMLSQIVGACFSLAIATTIFMIRHNIVWVSKDDYSTKTYDSSVPCIIISGIFVFIMMFEIKAAINSFINLKINPVFVGTKNVIDLIRGEYDSE